MNHIHKNLNRNFARSLFVVMIGSMLTTVFNLPEVFSWIYRGAIIYIFISHLNLLRDKANIDKHDFNLIIIFILWLLYGFVRGATDAADYWEWKNVVTQLLLALFYIVIFVGTITDVIKQYYKLYWYYFLPMLIIALVYDRYNLILDYVPYATLMLFFSLIPKNKKWLLAGIVLFFFISLSQRNDLVKVMVMSFTGLCISYFYLWIPKWSIRLVHTTLLALPIILLWLGVTGRFNVFDMDSYIHGNYTQEIKTNQGEEVDNLKADTRSPIYRNVFYTMKTYNAWVIGRSTAHGDIGLEGSWGIDENTGIVGRYGNEVGILDILLWYGIIGTIIYFAIYVRASYLAVYRSKSRFAVGVGLYVAFLWIWAFIWEKPAFETYFMMDLLLLGLCFSKQFREMTDQDVKNWVAGIFAK